VSFYDLSITGPRRIRLPEIRFNTKALAFAPNGPLLAAVTDESATVRLYDYGAALPSMIVQLSAPTLKTHDAVLRFSPDGGRLALKFNQGPLILWDDVNQLRKLIDHRKQLSLPATTTALAFTADGRYLAVGGPKGLLYLLRLDEPVSAPDWPASAR
jgi:WD40 repeat protein